VKIPENEILRHEPERRRFLLEAQEGTAEITYRLYEKALIVEHTFVPQALRGRGVAERLTRYALKEIQKLGCEIKAECSYTQSFLQRVADQKE
jgi:predicted GNAT family acetyltransferase